MHAITVLPGATLGHRLLHKSRLRRRRSDGTYNGIQSRRPIINERSTALGDLHSVPRLRLVVLLESGADGQHGHRFFLLLLLGGTIYKTSFNHPFKLPFSFAFFQVGLQDRVTPFTGVISSICRMSCECASYQCYEQQAHWAINDVSLHHPFREVAISTRSLAVLCSAAACRSSALLLP